MRISDWSSDVCSSDLDIGGRARDELRGLGGGDMFEDDLERGERTHQRFERAFDEHRLAVENVDVMVGGLAVDQERHADVLPPPEYAHAVRDIGEDRKRVV